MALTPFYLKINDKTSFQLNLDAQIYDTDVAAACGLTKTAPAAGIDAPPVPLRVALNSGQVFRVKARAVKGKKRRTVPLVCDKASLAGISGKLAGKTFTLGNGTGSIWTIQRVV
jgi:hypothetical protein